MENSFAKSYSSSDVNDVVKNLSAGSPAFILCLYGPSVDSKGLQAALKATGIPFVGCMDAVGRWADTGYQLGEDSIVGLALSKTVVSDVRIASTSMAPGQGRDAIHAGAQSATERMLSELSIDPDDPDMAREFVINLLYGLESATPYLEGVTSAGMMIPQVGGSSGGRLDFGYTDVMSPAGVGPDGVSAFLRLNKDFAIQLIRVTSFEKSNIGEMKVTKLSGPRHILEFNGKPARQAWVEALGSEYDFSPETFAHWTLGIDPGEGEPLITSIMKDDGETGVLTYNDVVPDTQFNIYRALAQGDRRGKALEKIAGAGNVIAYVSFDCILCYLARSAMNDVEGVSSVYNQKLGNTPRVGFATFSENIHGANVNQTETALVITKIS